MFTRLLIMQWWDELTTIHQIFWGIALVFTILFIIQFIMSLIGLDYDSDIEIGGDTLEGDMDFDHSFQLFSLRSIIAFFSFFGWIGLFVLNRSEQVWLAVFLAVMGGFIAMTTVAYLMYLMTKLEEEGNVHIKNAIHESGEVYLTIPGKETGRGKIHVNIQGALKEVDAITKGKELPTGTKIKVVDIINKNTVLVESIPLS